MKYRFLFIALAASMTPTLARSAEWQQIRTAAEFVGSVKVTDAKCGGISEHEGGVAAYLARQGITKDDRASDIFQTAMQEYIEKKQSSTWACVRAYMDFGPDNPEERMFDIAPSDSGADFLWFVRQSEIKAATDYRLATNARNACGLSMDERVLIRNILEDGIDMPFFHMTRDGETPSREQEETEGFKIQRQAWSDAETRIRSYGGLRPYCHAMWSMFGENGTEYPGVLAKPELPFSPYELQ